MKMRRKKTYRTEVIAQLSRYQPHKETRHATNDRRVLGLVGGELDVVLRGEEGVSERFSRNGTRPNFDGDGP